MLVTSVISRRTRSCIWAHKPGSLLGLHQEAVSWKQCRNVFSRLSLPGPNTREGREGGRGARGCSEVTYSGFMVLGAGAAAWEGDQYPGLEAAACGDCGLEGHDVHWAPVLWGPRDAAHQLGLRLPPLRCNLALPQGLPKTLPSCHIALEIADCWPCLLPETR